MDRKEQYSEFVFAEDTIVKAFEKNAKGIYVGHKVDEAVYDALELYDLDSSSLTEILSSVFKAGHRAGKKTLQKQIASLK